MERSLSDLVNNFSQVIHRIKSKYGNDDKTCKTCGIKYKDWDCFSEYANFKDYLIAYKCLCCNKITNTIDEKLKERFFNTYKFYNHDNNNFIFLLREGVYLNKYMDVCEKLN